MPCALAAPHTPNRATSAIAAARSSAAYRRLFLATISGSSHPRPHPDRPEFHAAEWMVRWSSSAPSHAHEHAELLQLVIPGIACAEIVEFILTDDAHVALVEVARLKCLHGLDALGVSFPFDRCVSLVVIGMENPPMGARI